jgi:lambda repressor-like predicted transcriptional regulator
MSATRKPNINANLSASADRPPELVIYELHRRRLSLRQLSIRNARARRTLCDALRKPRRRAEKIIAGALR